MLPRMAMPSAPPNSELVSASPAAVPARSGGTVPMIRSVDRVKIGARPNDMTM